MGRLLADKAKLLGVIGSGRVDIGKRIGHRRFAE